MSTMLTETTFLFFSFFTNIPYVNSKKADTSNLCWVQLQGGKKQEKKKMHSGIFNLHTVYVTFQPVVFLKQYIKTQNTTAPPTIR